MDGWNHVAEMIMAERHVMLSVAGILRGWIELSITSELEESVKKAIFDRKYASRCRIIYTAA